MEAFCLVGGFTCNGTNGNRVERELEWSNLYGLF